MTNEEYKKITKLEYKAKQCRAAGIDPENRRWHGLGHDAHAGVPNGDGRPALLGTAAPDPGV